MTTKAAATPFWTLPLPDLLQRLDTSLEGLASEEAQRRLIRFGADHLRRKSRVREAVLLLSQFKSDRAHPPVGLRPFIVSR
jgi:P-type Mg2+ transporter